MELGFLLGLILGLVVLVAGAEILVRGASALAAALGVSPLVIGLTVVAYGTSAPEVAVSLNAGFDGQPGIAIGNAVGSNIFNVLFILGISALITPLRVDQQLVWFDVQLMIGVAVVALVMGLDGTLGRWDGLLLLAGLVAYSVWSIWQSRKETAAVKAEYEAEFGRGSERKGPWKLVLDFGLLVAGLVLLVLGSRWFVSGAVELAQRLGISDLIIGLTIIAAGTSLPEVATSILAAARGERDIAVGNVVGSNIFNILAVLGISSTVVPGGMPVSQAALGFDFPVMIAVAFACLPVFSSGHEIARWEGGLFLAYYVAYTTYLVLDATGHDALPAFSAVMAVFVLPLTVITLLVVAVRSFRTRTESERNSAGPIE